MPKFKDPKTGKIVNVNYFLVFLSCFLFGLFFFLYIGETQHALVMVGFAIFITLLVVFIDWIAILYALIFPFIYSLIAPKIVQDKWLNKGYIPLDDDQLIQVLKDFKETFIIQALTTPGKAKPAIIVFFILFFGIILLN